MGLCTYKNTGLNIAKTELSYINIYSSLGSGTASLTVFHKQLHEVVETKP